MSPARCSHIAHHTPSVSSTSMFHMLVSPQAVVVLKNAALPYGVILSGA